MHSIEDGLKRKIANYEDRPDMRALIDKLTVIPNSYSAFIAAVIAYTSKSPIGLGKLMNYLEANEKSTTSDVLRFISTQEDFHDWQCNSNIK